MSDAELSDIADDDDIVRRHENADNDLEDEAEENNQDFNLSGEEVNETDENVQKKDDKAAPKKHVTRKLFVLNTERLKGPKGVHTIEKLYEGFKFQGKGHEKDDLDRVMKRLECWAFRLYPKLDFDDFLAKCEHLGHKKDLQTHLKKYRLGMISADDVFASNEFIEDDEEMDPAVPRTGNESLAEISNDEFQKLFDDINPPIERTEHTDDIRHAGQVIKLAEPAESLEYTKLQITEPTEIIKTGDNIELQVSESIESEMGNAQNVEQRVTNFTELMDVTENIECQVTEFIKPLDNTENIGSETKKSIECKKHAESIESQVIESTEDIDKIL